MRKKNFLICFLLGPLCSARHDSIILGESQVRLARGQRKGLMSREGLMSIVTAQGWLDHACITCIPSNWSGNWFDISQLQGINNSQDLIKVPSSGCRIQDGELHPLVRPNDEDSSSSDWDSLIVLFISIQHSEVPCKHSIAVIDDGVWQILAMFVAIVQDVLAPSEMILNRITGESNDLDLPLLELVDQLNHLGQLCGAHRGVVTRV